MSYAGLMQVDTEALYGAVEAGGTKFVCALADGSGKIHEERRFPTTDPAATLAATCEFLHAASGRIGRLAAIGVASFGPIHLRRDSSLYGCIGKTPKPGWSGTDIVGVLAREFSCPIGFDTDVNAAALAEHRWGAARGVDSMVYVTIGTGIGGGVLNHGAPIHGLMHPEIGHIHPRRHPLDQHFSGVCPFHGDCLEGLASGPAIVARSGRELREIEPTHPQWHIEADYLGQLCAQLVVTVSPQRIVLGGGVMNSTQLLAPIRKRLLHWLGGYVDRAEILEDVEHYVVTPALDAQSGVLGALLLAMDASMRFSAK
jgi:fructokinase